MGHTTLNIEKDRLLILEPQQQSLFTSNQEEIDTRIALNGSDGSKPVLVKAKDRYINFNGACFCFNFSTIWLASTDTQWQGC